MDWKLHIIVSLFLYFLIASFFQFSLSYSISALLLLVFSSLLPDMDHPKSMIRKLMFLAAFYLFILFVVVEMMADIWIKVIIMSIILILTYYFFRNIPLKHRGKRSLHLWRYVFISGSLSSVFFALANINISLALFIIIGYGSHLTADRVFKI